MLVFFAAWAAARIAGLEDLPTLTVLLGAASASLLSSASMMVNDWHDVEEDRINKPGRPIPSGRVRRPHALALGIALFIAGMLTGALSHESLGWLAVLVTALSAAYTLFLKRVVLVGNQLVALLSTYPLWCWMPQVHVLRRSHLLLTASCFIFLIGREILKTAEDVSGDGSSGIRTVATVLGVRFANRLGSALLCAGLLLCWWPALAGETIWFYDAALAVATVTTGAVLVSAFFLRAGADPSASRRFALAAEFTLYLMAAAFGFGFSA